MDNFEGTGFFEYLIELFCDYPEELKCLIDDDLTLSVVLGFMKNGDLAIFANFKHFRNDQKYVMVACMSQFYPQEFREVIRAASNLEYKDYLYKLRDLFADYRSSRLSTAVHFIFEVSPNRAPYLGE